MSVRYFARASIIPNCKSPHRKKLWRCLLETRRCRQSVFPRNRPFFPFFVIVSLISLSSPHNKNYTPYIPAEKISLCPFFFPVFFPVFLPPLSSTGSPQNAKTKLIPAETVKDDADLIQITQRATPNLHPFHLALSNRVQPRDSRIPLPWGKKKNLPPCFPFLDYIPHPHAVHPGLFYLTGPLIAALIFAWLQPQTSQLQFHWMPECFLPHRRKTLAAPKRTLWKHKEDEWCERKKCPGPVVELLRGEKAEAPQCDLFWHTILHLSSVGCNH